jgi:hypothetical protein
LANLPEDGDRSVKRAQLLHPEGIAVTPAGSTSVNPDEKDGDTELMDTE